jgi:hypothetical protein
MLFKVISTTDLCWEQHLCTVPYDFYHLPGYLELEAKRHQAIAEAILIEAGSDSFFLPYLIRNCQQNSESTAANGEIYDVISPYGYPGMLVSESGQNSNFINKCWNLIHQYWQEKNICSAFIRLHPILNNYINPVISEDINRFSIYNQGDVVICNLTNDPDDLWQQTRRNHRNNIIKLKRSGFNARMAAVEQYLDVFVDIYQETMSRVNADSNYFFSKSYFEDFVQALGDKINMCVVEIDEQVIAASLITEFSGTVQYHLCGTRTEFLSRSPNTIMLSHIITWAKQRNNQYLNLGGGLGNHQDSLYHFKRGFSKQTKSFTTIRSIIDRENYEYLTHLQAKLLNRTVSEISNSSFFPAYRSSYYPQIV